MVGPKNNLAKEVAESMGTVPDPNPSFVSLVLKDDAVVTFRFESDHGMSGDDLARCFVAFVTQKYGTHDDGEEKEEAGSNLGLSTGDIALTESAVVSKERVAQLTEML